MSFRARLTLVAAGAVAAAIIALAGVLYVVIRSELRGQVDRSLTELADRAGNMRRTPPPASLRSVRLPAPRLGAPGGYLQIVPPSGRPIRPGGGAAALPVSDATRKVRTGDRLLEDATVDGVHVRILAIRPRGSPDVVQIARPLTEVDRILDRFGVILLVSVVAGVAIAAAAGFLVARSAIAPVARLTSAAEHVAATQDLSARIDHPRNDELGRLAEAFNRMLEALRRSRRAQRQLVADASHELRTPLTSLRANLELFQEPDKLDDADREAMLDDAVSQARELSVLVGDLVDLARDGEAPAVRRLVQLDEVVTAAIRRAAARGPSLRFDARGVDPSVVIGDPDALERAVVNLLDNAIKWSPPSGTVEVTLCAGRLTVSDDGPGISDADLPHVFERFYRAEEARSRPGSGLGLAIVRQVAEAHGGAAFAQRRAGGGTELVLELPVEPQPAFAV